MNKTYEFGFQSRKQKAILWSCKLFIAFLLGSAIHSLGWEDATLQEKLNSTGSIFFFFWIYSNLCRVKIEVQELFVPPFDNMHMAECVLIAFSLAMFDLYLIIHDIGRLSGWWL